MFILFGKGFIGRNIYIFIPSCELHILKCSSIAKWRRIIIIVIGMKGPTVYTVYSHGQVKRVVDSYKGSVQHYIRAFFCKSAGLNWPILSKEVLTESAYAWTLCIVYDIDSMWTSKFKKLNTRPDVPPQACRLITKRYVCTGSKALPKNTRKR